jgi:hypothetical protein|tara:strand:- start:223 stop:477 length:255 start_codon:yes stop_codon:yes gene_type:complete
MHSNTMLWLKRWNFIERARLERELWDAFEARQNPEAKLEELRSWIDAADPSEPSLAEQRFRLEVWTTTLSRIRKIEAMMTSKKQ